MQNKLLHKISSQNNILRKFCIIFSLLLVTSCGPYWYKPNGKVFKNAPTTGTPGFRLGWMHGCESGFSSQFGGAMYMSFYQWKKDPDISSPISSPESIARIREKYGKKELAKVNWNNPAEVQKNFSDYRYIFWGAHIYCRHSALGTLQAADMNPPLPSEERYNPAKADIGNVYRIDGKGDTRWGYW